MKSGYLVSGIIILLLGGFIVANTQNAMAEYHTSMGQFLRAISPEARQNYSYIQALNVFGVLVVIIGLGFLVYGAAASPPKPQVVIPRICKYCGRVLPEDAVFCPYCGRAQD